MPEFIIRFLICNIFISIIIGILLLLKHLLQNNLTRRMHYNLWFLLLALLAVPFIPIQPIYFLQILAWFKNFKNISASPSETITEQTAAQNELSSANWMNDFSISVSRNTPSTIGFALSILFNIAPKQN